MSARDEHHAFRARMVVREAALSLARAGLSDEVIRECLRDMAETEAEHAIAWGKAYDQRMALADREEFAEAFARDAETEECA